LQNVVRLNIIMMGTVFMKTRLIVYSVVIGIILMIAVCTIAVALTGGVYSILEL